MKSDCNGHYCSQLYAERWADRLKSIIGISKVGLSKKKHLPVIYTTGRSFNVIAYLWQLKSFWNWKFSKLHGLTKAKHNKDEILLDEYSAMLVIREYYRLWKKVYIPPFSLDGLTILDIGAGCGETAHLYFEHGAEKVIAVEPEKTKANLLGMNSRNNDWNIEVIEEPFRLRHLDLPHDFMKMDGEGCESELLKADKIKPSVIEIHSNYVLSNLVAKFKLNLVQFHNSSLPHGITWQSSIVEGKNHEGCNLFRTRGL